jgi:periplasmic protein CpxP/Spy
MLIARRNLNFIFPLVLAAWAAVFLLAGCHRHPGGDPHKMADHIVKMMRDKLDLTVDQTTKVQALANEVADTLVARHKNHTGGKGQDELLKQLRSNTVDTAALDQEIVTREAKFQEMHGFMIQKFVELHDILTPEQRGKLADFLEKHKGEWGGPGDGKGHWKHPHGGPDGDSTKSGSN